MLAWLLVADCFSFPLSGLPLIKRIDVVGYIRMFLLLDIRWIDPQCRAGGGEGTYLIIFWAGS
jgi:hypothetical protein